MEAGCSVPPFVNIYRTVQHYIQRDDNFYVYRRENFKCRNWEAVEFFRNTQLWINFIYFHFDQKELICNSKVQNVQNNWPK
jgi:hypothetical protein